MPLIDLANPAGSQALAQLAGPFGSYLGGGSFPQSYEFAKRFVSNPTTAYGSGNNGVTSLDDPTFLGFSLMFDITSPLFNGAITGGSGITPPVQSPAPTADGEVAVSGLGIQTYTRFVRSMAKIFNIFNRPIHWYYRGRRDYYRLS